MFPGCFLGMTSFREKTKIELIFFVRNAILIIYNLASAVRDKDRFPWGGNAFPGRTSPPMKQRLASLRRGPRIEPETL